MLLFCPACIRLCYVLKPQACILSAPQIWWLNYSSAINAKIDVFFFIFTNFGLVQQKNEAGWVLFSFMYLKLQQCYFLPMSRVITPHLSKDALWGIKCKKPVFLTQIIYCLGPNFVKIKTSKRQINLYLKVENETTALYLSFDVCKINKLIKT